MPTNSLHFFVATNPGLEEQEQQEEKREEQEKEEEAAAEAEEEKEEVEKEEEKEEEILPTISSSRFGVTYRRPSTFIMQYLHKRRMLGLPSRLGPYTTHQLCVALFSSHPWNRLHLRLLRKPFLSMQSKGCSSFIPY